MSGYVSLGKYDNARDDALHFLCTSDWSNGEFGNMDFGAYVWRIDNTADDVKQENSEFNSVMEDWFEINPEVEDSSTFRDDLVGHFMVIQADSGAVSVVKFDTEQELNAKYLEMLHKFMEWDEQTNGED